MSEKNWKTRLLTSSVFAGALIASAALPAIAQADDEPVATTAPAADEAEAKMCIAFDCVQSATNGIGSAVHVSRNVGFKVIKSKAVIVDGAVHHFTLIRAQ